VNSLLEVKSQVQRLNLDISLFYADRISDIFSLVESVSTSQFRPQVWPNPNLFSEINDKMIARTFLEGLGLALPPGAVISDYNELTAFRRQHGTVFAKPRHHETVRISRDDPRNPELTFPLLVEAEVPEVISSPVTCWLQLKGEAAYLGSTYQILDGPNYRGNLRDPGLLGTELESRLIEMCSSIAAALPDHQGPAGLDTVVTAEGDILAVDLNLRFNSSTYLLYLIHRLNVSDSAFVDYREYESNVRSLDDLSPVLNLSGNPPTGAIGLGPVLDAGFVSRFFGIAIGETETRVQSIRIDLERAASRGR
jgi:hypothetical protein